MLFGIFQSVQIVVGTKFNKGEREREQFESWFNNKARLRGKIFIIERNSFFLYRFCLIIRWKNRNSDLYEYLYFRFIKNRRYLPPCATVRKNCNSTHMQRFLSGIKEPSQINVIPFELNMTKSSTINLVSVIWTCLSIIRRKQQRITFSE